MSFKNGDNMYYIIKQGDNLDEIIKEVEGKGFINSYWSCSRENCAAIALYYYPFNDMQDNPYHNGNKEFILLNREMAGLEFGADLWVGCRKEYNSMAEMFSAMEDRIRYFADKVK